MTAVRRRVLLTTDPGLEDLVKLELLGLAPEAIVVETPAVEPGQVICETSRSTAELFRLAMVHHVIDVLGEARVDGIGALREFVSGVEVSALEGAASFRVSSTCAGAPALDRLDVQRAAGGVLHKRYGTPVDLSGYAIHVRVDCDDGLARLGLQQTREPLSNRIRRGGVLRSSLRPTVASAMLRLAGAADGSGTLIDPMCGAGVIPVEAARLNPRLDVAATDWDAPTVAIAAGTFSNHDLSIVPRSLDARVLGKIHPAAFDYIVTDPPYGVRQGKKTKLGSLYGDLLNSFALALKPSGRLALVVVRHRTFERALAGTSLRVVHRREVSAGSLRLAIFILERHS